MSRVRHFFAAAIMGAGVAAAPAAPVPPDTTNADERDFTAMSLEELGLIKVPTVYGASKHEQTTADAPSAVSIVTREDIQQFGYRTLGDLLRSVRGFYVTYDRAYNFTGLRGVNRPGDFGGRVLINIDGHRLNEPLYDSAFTDTEFLLDLDLVDRVEVIRGPGSSLYGNNAFFTVINVVTRRGGELNGAETAASAGSFDTYTGRVSFGRAFAAHGAELLLSGTYLDSAGHSTLSFPGFPPSGETANDIDGSRAKSVYGAVRWGPLSLNGGYVDRTKNIPTAQLGTIFNDPRYRYRDVRGFAELGFSQEVGEWRVDARGAYDCYRFDADYPFDYPPVTLNYDRAKAQWLTGELLVSRLVAGRHRLTLGGEARRDFQLDLANFDLAPPATYIDSRRSAHAYALYAQDEIRLPHNLLLNAGVRHDRFSTFGSTLNPRGALVYRPRGVGTFKLLYGEAFRAPNDYELDYIAPAYRANPDLRPETIRSFEAVYERALAANLHVTGSFFRSRINRLIGQLLDPESGLNYFDNAQHVHVQGFEGELEGRWAHGLRSRLSYTYAEARLPATNTLLNNSPRHLGKASVVAPLPGRRMSAACELQAMSRRQTEQGGETGSVCLVNVTLFTAELLQHTEISLSVYNALDRHYSDPASSDFAQNVVPQDGRTFRVKLARRF